MDKQYKHSGQAVSTVQFYLSKSILSNGLESLFHVDRFLGAGLKVGDFVFGLTPLLRTPGGHGAVVKIYFVSEDNKGEVVGVSGAGLDINVMCQKW